ncbi:hypothetical protein B9Z55_024752 [Caenorhabditis nigoni]|uniref:Phlebovirus glycoprotein G2 fusion domain-containing protein n=1 Tax=Caenorhabditis nigoni TaxID=1611254 RepID=A0A2G5SW31_9PELO|nr:hypothetical protein B9Z55_024752 [Caenorhabditis nigoni]
MDPAMVSRVRNRWIFFVIFVVLHRSLSVSMMRSTSLDTAKYSNYTCTDTNNFGTDISSAIGVVNSFSLNNFSIFLTSDPIPIHHQHHHIQFQNRFVRQYSSLSRRTHARSRPPFFGLILQHLCIDVISFSNSQTHLELQGTLCDYVVSHRERPKSVQRYAFLDGVQFD